MYKNTYQVQRYNVNMRSCVRKKTNTTVVLSFITFAAFDGFTAVAGTNIAQ